jgi:hypothetical protein
MKVWMEDPLNSHIRWKRLIAIVALLVVVIGIPVFLFSTWWADAGHFIVWYLQGSWITWTLIAASITAFILGFRAYGRESSGLVGIIVGIVSILGLIFFMSTYGYFSKRGLLEDSNVQTTESAGELSFKERAAWDVATQVSNRWLGNTTGESTGTVKSLSGSGEWTVSVVKRGIGQGYESVQSMKLPLYGEAKQSDIKFCKYSAKADRRLGGFWWWNALGMEISKVSPLNTIYDRDDAFASCESDHPVLYVPLKKNVGFPYTHSAPAGVVIYDGITGEVTYHADYKNVKYPVYPQSVAADQREALKASGSYWDYLFGRSGYEDTSGDNGDPNGANRNEFNLSYMKGGSAYVSPLTPRGSSTSIVAISTLGNNTITYGKLAPITVNKFADDKSRQANSSVEASITAGALSGYKAAGLTVFEIVPSSDGNWTASIGKSQSILYRATITLDGDITLKDKDGNVVNADNESAGNDDSGSSDDGNDLIGTDDDGSLKLKKPLKDMTTDELKSVSRSILSELTAINDELSDRASK